MSRPARPSGEPTNGSDVAPRTSPGRSPVAGFGVVRQLFERRLAAAGVGEREELLEGPAGAVRLLLHGGASGATANDISFAVMHGLYWLTTNLADRGPSVLLVLDDAHWADDASLRWLAYVAPRIEGPAVALLVAMRPAEPATSEPPLLTVRAHAGAVARPRRLTERGVATVVRGVLGADASDEKCTWFKRVSGGNPFYLRELLRMERIGDEQADGLELARLADGGGKLVGPGRPPRPPPRPRCAWLCAGARRVRRRL
jgi:hypothetical protein